MTTIAYDGQYIAFDSWSTAGDTVVSDDTNKVLASDNGVFVFSGTLKDAAEFVAEHSIGGGASRSFSIVAFFIDLDGVVWRTFEDDGVFVAERPQGPWAAGSGKYWAIAAMDHGKDAVGAVRYAMTRDIHTGGAIRRLCTKTLKMKVFKR